MKIAYVILAHKDSDHIKRLSNKLTINTDNKVFIHLDKKINLNKFKENCPETEKIKYVLKREEVYWGGFSSIISTINVFEEILFEKEYERVVILQGLDYPIKSNKEINNFFEKNKNLEYIKAFNETDTKDIVNLHKYCFYWYLDKNNFLKNCINRINTVLLKLKILIRFKKPYIYVNNIKYKIYRGWAHIALTKNAVQYIVNFYNKNKEFNKYFQTIYASDESYFHTILYNSYFKKNTVLKKEVSEKQRENMSILNLTYFEYPKFVKVFKKIEELKKIDKKEYLYIRKVDSDSSELLDYIDENTK